MQDHWWYIENGRIWTLNEKVHPPLCSRRAPFHTGLYIKSKQNHSQTSVWPQSKQDILALRYYFTKCSLPVPVLRLQSQASASARSCFMGPSQDGLICKNIHYTEMKIRNRSDTTVSVRGSYEVYNSSLYLFQSSVYIHLHLHDKQVWGLDELLHHFCPVNAVQRQIWV